MMHLIIDGRPPEHERAGFQDIPEPVCSKRTCSDRNAGQHCANRYKPSGKAGPIVQLWIQRTLRMVH